MGKTLGVCAAVLLCCDGSAFAQNLRYGVIVGSAVTNDFRSSRETYLDPFNNVLNSTLQTSAARGFVMGGALLEWNFSHRLSVEGDGIFRELHFNETQAGPRDSVVTWEFPVLLKYKFRAASRSAPFIESGPSFRTAGNTNGTNPSHAGFTVGAGLAIHLHQIDISPAFGTHAGERTIALD